MNHLLSVIAASRRRAAPSAFPVIEGTATTIKSTAATSHAINLPSGIQSGEILLLLVRTGATSGTFSPPSGFSSVSSLSTGLAYAWAKTATGSEGSTVTTTSASSRRLVAVSYRISNAQASEAAYLATAAATTPSLTPSWGSAKTLWISCIGVNDNDAFYSLTSPPSGFSNTQYIETTDAAGAADQLDCQLMTATQELEASSLSPGSFTGSGTLSTPRRFLVAIQPTT